MTYIIICSAVLIFIGLLTAGNHNDRLGPITWLYEWWSKNFHNGGGKIDTSRVAKFVVMIFTVVFMLSMAGVFGVVGWEFFVDGKKTGKLLLSPSALKTLGYVVGAMFTALMVDYRVARITNGKGH